MKTKKTLKEQITAALSLALVALAIAVYAPGQSMAQPKTRKGARAQGGRRVIMANTEGDFHLRGRTNRANANGNRRVINWGGGGATLNSAVRGNGQRLIGGLLIPGNAAKGR